MDKDLRFRAIETLTWMLEDIDFRNRVDVPDCDKDLPPRADSPELAKARQLLKDLQNEG